jgi:hypothetical protein
MIPEQDLDAPASQGVGVYFELTISSECPESGGRTAWSFAIDGYCFPQR